MHPDIPRPTRRRFVQLAAGLFGASALTPLLNACSGAPPSAPTAAPSKPAEAPKPTDAAKPAAPAQSTAPAATTSAAQGDRLVVAVGQWGIETPWAWRASQSEKNLWDHLYDPLIMRDQKTLEYRPGLALEWKPSADFKTWTFKLRQGVMFHGDYGELTSDDVKFTVEQNLRPDVQGASAPFFRAQLDKIETPDKYTVLLSFKNPAWEVPSHFVEFSGYQNVTSKKHIEQVGEEKAAQAPIGTGPYRYVDGKQGDFHRFQAAPNHWRVTPAFKEMIVRRVPDPATRLAGVRAGDIDVGNVAGDYLDQARKASLKIHEVPTSGLYHIILSGQTLPDKEDSCAQCPWVGDLNDPASLAKAKKVREALNLAVNKQAIIDGLWKGAGSQTPFQPWFYPFNKGYIDSWKVPPYDVQRAKQLLAEAGVGNGFEIRVNPMVFPFANDGPDVMEAVALDWEKVGIKAKRVQEDWGSFVAKVRARKTAQAFWVYAAPPFDEPVLGWQRTIWSKGAFEMLAESPDYDKLIEALLREVDPDKRAKLHNEMGTALYNDYRSVMIGIKNTTWALSKRVGAWPSLAFVPLENRLEYITPA